MTSTPPPLTSSSSNTAATAPPTSTALVSNTSALYWGIPRDEQTPVAGLGAATAAGGLSKKALKAREAAARRAAKDAITAPPVDRVPLPPLPKTLAHERWLALRDAQQRRFRITTDAPPSVCLYTVSSYC